MVQVLPYVSGFGEKLGQVLANAGGDISQGYLNGRQRKSDQSIISQFGSAENQSPIGLIQSYSRLSPQAQQTIAPFLQQFMQSQGKQAEATQAADMEKEEVGQTLNSLTDELMKGKLGTGWQHLNKLTSSGRESRAYFDELALGIEKRLAGMVGKGALSKARFDYMVKNLPSSSDSDARNRGKLKALSEEFKVEIKNPEFRKQLGMEESAEKSSSIGDSEQKPLDQKMAQEFLNKANGDKEKARALAKKSGYSF